MTKTDKTPAKSKFPHPVYKVFSLVFNSLFYLLLAFALVNFILSKLGPGFQIKYLGFEMRAVVSESMTGTIDKGDTIVSTRTKLSELKAGDIITFKTDYYQSPKGDPYIITHRIVSANTVLESGKTQYAFKTRGDNNPAEDPFTVSGEDVISEFRFIIPGSGFIYNKVIPFMKTPSGIFATTVLLLSIVGAYAIVNILLREIKKEGERKKQAEKAAAAPPEEEPKIALETPEKTEDSEEQINDGKDG